MLVKSPVVWVGGKHFLKQWIIEKIPTHKVWVEVFCGSCVISFTKKPSEITIVNDIDKNLISFWKVLQDNTKRKQLISFLDNMLYSRTLWRELRERWKLGNTPTDPIERAGEWFFLNRSSYASDIQHGGFIGYTQGRNMCKTFRNAVDQLNEVGELVKTWIIENLPFQECIRRFDSPDTVFYCDMPYYLPGKRECYQDSFTLNDHKALAELLNNIKARALVSHYKDNIISELYEGWSCYEYESFKGSSNGDRKPRTQECLFTNFEVKQKTLFSGMTKNEIVSAVV